MAIGKSREELYELFKTGAKPAGADFKDLIDSAVNSNDDGIEKPLGDDTPLKINARGDTENLLDFYAGDIHIWRINQKPTPDLPGLNFATAMGDNSRLFIDSSTGKVGLSTTVPKAKLHIQQNGSEDALRIEDEETDTTPLVVDASGNVGIGKPNPDEKLDVQGNAAFSGGLTISETLKAQVLRVDSHDRTSHVNGDGILYRKGGQFYLTVDDHFYIRDSASSTASDNVKFHFNTNDGKLTLNDTNSSLEVKGTGASSFAGSLKIDGKLTLPGAQQIVFENDDTTNNLKLQLWRGFGLGINDATLFYAANGNHSWRDNNGTNERMKLNTTASGGLEVMGTGISSFKGSLNIVNTNQDANGNTLVLGGPANQANLRLGYHQNYAWVQSHNAKPLVINPIGNNVGIGTTNPRAKLEVIGDIWAYKKGVYFLDKNNSTADGMGIRYKSDGVMSLFCDGVINFLESDNDQEKMAIDLNNGNLQLKHGGNVATMSVNGNELKFSLSKSRHNSKSSVRWDGDSNWDFDSDICLKQDIEIEQNILCRLMQLDVKNFRWKDNPTSVKKIGMIAQDVQPLFPALVGQMTADNPEDESTLTLKYGAFGVLAIGGLKELKLEKDREIARLEVEIEALRSQLAALSDR